MLVRPRLLGTALLIAFVVTAASALGFFWPNESDRVASALSSADVGVRRSAARKLTTLPRAMAERLIEKAFDDPDIEVRLSAADAALDIPIAGLGQKLLDWLNAPDRRVRLMAAELLEKYPYDGAVELLGRMLSDKDVEVRIAAAAALAESRHEAAVMPLLSHLDDSVPRVREVIVESLAELSDRRAVIPLIGKVQDAQASVRRVVTRALGQLGDARASAALLLALRDSDAEVRASAVRALGLLKDQSSVVTVAALLSDDRSSMVRAAAARALGGLGGRTALTALLDALAEPRPKSEREALIEALSAAGTPAVKLSMDCLSRQPSLLKARGCSEVLAQSSFEGGARAIMDAMGRGALSPVDGLEALGELGNDASLATVLEYLSHDRAQVRRAAIEAAAHLLDPEKKDDRAVEPIVSALYARGRGSYERSALARLLGRTRSRHALSPLSRLASASSSPEVAADEALRVAAIDGLGLLGPFGQDGVLLRALDDESPRVRLSAALALRRSAAGATAAKLIHRFSSRASQDRDAVLVALSGALSRAKDTRLGPRLQELLSFHDLGQRDALLEAWARLPSATPGLVEFLRSSALGADRAKLAEGLAEHPGGLSALRKLARGRDASARANAVWSLGAVGRAEDAALVSSALSDPDVSVAGNAAAALGRIAARTQTGIIHAPTLCRALENRRSYVRANALAALRVVRKRCEEGQAREALLKDRSELVRERAAALILDPDTKQNELDRRALRQCAAREHSGRVATSCLQSPPPLTAETEAVTVMVVPLGESEPVPGAAFALVFSNGLIRLGQADRRGAVFEAFAPRGELRLTMPAPLAL